MATKDGSGKSGDRSFTERLRPRPLREWSETSRGIAAAGAIFLLSRLVTLIVAHIVVLLTGTPGVPEVLSLWDGAFYIQIAESGYQSGAAPGAMTDAMAFFPGYPLAMRALSAISGASLAITGIALTTVAAAGGMSTIWILVRRLTDAATATRTIVLLSFFPSAYVLSMVYAEGSFMLVAAGALFALLRERWFLAGALSAVATSLRPNGAILILCCLWAAGAALRRKGSTRPLIAPLLAPLGGLAYAGYLWVVTGTPLAFLEIQERTWGMRFDFGISNARTVLELAADLQLHRVVAVFVAFGIAGATYLLVKSRPPAVIMIYTVGLVALAVLSTNTTSIMRFVMSAFPLLIPLASRMGPGTFGAVTATSGALMVSSLLLMGVLFMNP